MSTRFLTSTIENLADGKQDEIGDNSLTISSTIGLQSALDGKQSTITDGSLSIAKTNGLQNALDGKQSTITDGSLSIAKTNGLQNALDGKQSTITDGSLSIAKTNGLQHVISGLQPMIVNDDLAISNTSGLQHALDALQPMIMNNDLTIAMTSGLQTALNSKQNTISDGDLSIARTNGLQNALDSKQSTIADGDLTIAKTSGLESRISTIEGTFDAYHPLNGSFSSQLVAAAGIRVKNGSSSSDYVSIDVSNAYANIKNTQNGNLNFLIGSSSTTPALTINSVNQTVGVGSGLFTTYQPATALEVRANSSQTANAYATVQVTSQNASCEPSLQLVNTATSKTTVIKQDANGVLLIDNNLSVNGMMTSVNVLRAEKKGSQNGYIELKETLNSNGLVDSSNSARMYFNMAGTAYIYWDGSNLVNTPTFNPSDERVKTHKTKVEADELSQAFDGISLYKYKYHEHFARDKGVDPEKYVYGFIAQDVREQTSHLSSQFTNVSTGEAVYPNEKIECEERLKVPNMETINKTDMIMLLWAKVKELQNRMHVLESK